MAEKADRIKKDLQGDLLDANHVTRRLFRCWLDGSYLGYEHYQENLAFLKANHDNERRMRMFVIQEFCKYTATDANCSYRYAQQIITETIPKRKLDKLNKALVADALDLIEDFLREEAA